MGEDGWYADPTGRSFQRLYVAGTWTRRVRSAEGVEATEGEDHSGAMAEALTPRPARGWTAERPSFGLATAAVGGVLGFTVLDWAAETSFADLRRTVAADPGQFDVVTQAYTKFVFLPLLVVVLVSGLLTTVGRTLARIAVALAGVVGGVGLVGVVIWIEGGGTGTDQSRGDALPVLTVMVAVGIVAAALGVGAYFDESAMLARGLAGTLAGLAVILHVYVVTDVFDGTSGSALGAWAPAIGYGLLTVAPALPYRRVLHT